MNILSTKINTILEQKNLSHRSLSKVIDEFDSSVNAMIMGKRHFKDSVIKKILPILEISREEFESWILADKYSKEVLELAIQAKKESTNNDKLILTAKIDEILQNKDMSRTALSKLIKHSQSGLNRVIIGKEPLSKKVLTKLANAFELPEDEIKSWVIADKYSLQVLESALNLS